MDMSAERSRPIAVFMAFGTKGDVYPIAAIAAAFASDQRKYEVVFITHTVHQDLAAHLAEKNVTYTPVTSPPVLSPPENDDPDGFLGSSFSIQKRTVTREHRKECLHVVERIFGDGLSLEEDFIVINFFALEGWSLAELFHVQCAIAAPYVVHYSMPSSFERKFRRELPLLYQYLQDAPPGKVCWNDVIHWMWPLFTDDWGSWRKDELNLSPWPFTDPVTSLPMWHDRPASPIVLYGFSREVVECPDYWPSNTQVCGFWFLPPRWQFSCESCQCVFDSTYELCPSHSALHSFLKTDTSTPLIFIGLSSVGSMGYMREPRAFLCVLQAALEITNCRFILLTAGYRPLDMAIQVIASEQDPSCLEQRKKIKLDEGVAIFDARLFCFSGSVPYSWLFRKCAVAIHHGGSGSTAAALHAGIPQVLCPVMLDQFYWAERMFWLGVAPEPLKRHHLLVENGDDGNIKVGAKMLSGAIDYALSPETRARVLEIAERVSVEDGVSEAVRILREEMSCPVNVKS